MRIARCDRCGTSYPAISAHQCPKGTFNENIFQGTQIAIPHQFVRFVKGIVACLVVVLAILWFGGSFRRGNEAIAILRQPTIRVPVQDELFSVEHLVANYDENNPQIMVGDIAEKAAKRVNWHVQQRQGPVYVASADINGRHFAFDVDIVAQTISGANDVSRRLLGTREQSVSLPRQSHHRYSLKQLEEGLVQLQNDAGTAPRGRDQAERWLTANIRPNDWPTSRDWNGPYVNAESIPDYFQYDPSKTSFYITE